MGDELWQSQLEALYPREQVEKLKAEQDHDDARQNAEHGISERRERESRSNRADRCPENSVGDDTADVEIERRLEFLKAVKLGMKLVVLRRQTQQEAARDGKAGRESGHEPDHERQAEAHVL